MKFKFFIVYLLGNFLDRGFGDVLESPPGEALTDLTTPLPNTTARPAKSTPGNNNGVSDNALRKLRRALSQDIVRSHSYPENVITGDSLGSRPLLGLMHEGVRPTGPQSTPTLASGTLHLGPPPAPVPYLNFGAAPSAQHLGFSPAPTPVSQFGPVSTFQQQVVSQAPSPQRTLDSGREHLGVVSGTDKQLWGGSFYSPYSASFSYAYLGDQGNKRPQGSYRNPNTPFWLVHLLSQLNRARQIYPRLLPGRPLTLNDLRYLLFHIGIPLSSTPQQDPIGSLLYLKTPQSTMHPHPNPQDPLRPLSGPLRPSLPPRTPFPQTLTMHDAWNLLTLFRYLFQPKLPFNIPHPHGPSLSLNMPFSRPGSFPYNPYRLPNFLPRPMGYIDPKASLLYKPVKPIPNPTGSPEVTIFPTGPDRIMPNLGKPEGTTPGLLKPLIPAENPYANSIAPTRPMANLYEPLSSGGPKLYLPFDPTTRIAPLRPPETFSGPGKPMGPGWSSFQPMGFELRIFGQPQSSANPPDPSQYMNSPPPGRQAHSFPLLLSMENPKDSNKSRKTPSDFQQDDTRPSRPFRPFGLGQPDGKPYEPFQPPTNLLQPELPKGSTEVPFEKSRSNNYLHKPSEWPAPNETKGQPLVPLRTPSEQPKPTELKLGQPILSPPTLKPSTPSGQAKFSSPIKTMQDQQEPIPSMFNPFLPSPDLNKPTGFMSSPFGPHFPMPKLPGTLRLNPYVPVNYISFPSKPPEFPLHPNGATGHLPNPFGPAGSEIDPFGFSPYQFRPTGYQPNRNRLPGSSPHPFGPIIPTQSFRPTGSGPGSLLFPYGPSGYPLGYNEPIGPLPFPYEPRLRLNDPYNRTPYPFRSQGRPNSYLPSPPQHTLTNIPVPSLNEPTVPIPSPVRPAGKHPNIDLPKRPILQQYRPAGEEPNLNDPTRLYQFRPAAFPPNFIYQISPNQFPFEPTKTPQFFKNQFGPPPQKITNKSNIPGMPTLDAPDLPKSFSSIPLGDIPYLNGPTGSIPSPFRSPGQQPMTPSPFPFRPYNVPPLFNEPFGPPRHITTNKPNRPPPFGPPGGMPNFKQPTSTQSFPFDSLQDTSYLNGPPGYLPNFNDPMKSSPFPFIPNDFPPFFTDPFEPPRHKTTGRPTTPPGNMPELNEPSFPKLLTFVPPGDMPDIHGPTRYNPLPSRPTEKLDLDNPMRPRPDPFEPAGYPPRFMDAVKPFSFPYEPSRSLPFYNGPTELAPFPFEPMIFPPSPGPPENRSNLSDPQGPTPQRFEPTGVEPDPKNPTKPRPDPFGPAGYPPNLNGPMRPSLFLFRPNNVPPSLNNPFGPPRNIMTNRPNRPPRPQPLEPTRYLPNLNDPIRRLSVPFEQFRGPPFYNDPTEPVPFPFEPMIYPPFPGPPEKVSNLNDPQEPTPQQFEPTGLKLDPKNPTKPRLDPLGLAGYPPNLNDQMSPSLFPFRPNNFPPSLNDPFGPPRNIMTNRPNSPPRLHPPEPTRYLPNFSDPVRRLSVPFEPFRDPPLYNDPTELVPSPFEPMIYPPFPGPPESPNDSFRHMGPSASSMQDPFGRTSLLQHPTGPSGQVNSEPHPPSPVTFRRPTALDLAIEPRPKTAPNEPIRLLLRPLRQWRPYLRGPLGPYESVGPMTRPRGPLGPKSSWPSGSMGPPMYPYNYWDLWYTCCIKHGI